jgi:hypothetical protein
MCVAVTFRERRSFRGGEKLTREAVGQIAVYGRTVAFEADAAVVRKLRDEAARSSAASLLSPP